MAKDDTTTAEPRNREDKAPAKSGRTPITLDFPIKVGGVATDTISLRRPLVADRRRADSATKTDAEMELHMISAMSDLTPDELDQVDLADYTKISEQLKNWLAPKSPPKD